MAHLLRLYSDISHHQNELNKGNESDTLLLIDYFDRCRQKFNKVENENVDLHSLMCAYDNDKENYRQDVKQLKAQLVEARSQVASLMLAKQSAENDKALLEEQIDTVRKVLRDNDIIPELYRKKFDFLTNIQTVRNHLRPSSLSLLSENDIDYDKTDDDLENETSFFRSGNKHAKPAHSNSGNARKRSRSVPRMHPSAPVIEEEGEPTSKRSSGSPQNRKEDIVESIPKTDNRISTVLVTPGSALTASNHAGGTEIRRSSLNKSISEPHLLSPQGNRDFFGRSCLTPFNSGPNGQSPALNIYTPSGVLSSRRHAFITRTILKPEFCDACGKRIAFSKSVLRCQECKTQCHPECREMVTLPCISRGTPIKNQKCKIADFVPQVPPMIPHILIHCISEIERRGIDNLGLYRVPGTESKVNELLDRFLWGKGVPNLRLIDDVNVIAGCVKKFLQQLKEPLIPVTSWNEFVCAAESKDGHGRPDSKALHRAIAELPMPNKDTLTFLILHLQRVAAVKEQNKMSIENLAKVFGPTIVGYSMDNGDLQRCLSESPKQETVMISLLSLPSEYWARLINSADGLPLIIEPTTPEIRAETYKQLRFDSATRLYPNLPVPSPRTPTFGSTSTMNFATPKSGSLKTRSQQKNFFKPPWKA